MWDYDKLFIKGNVIGLKDTKENKLYTHVVYEKEDWIDYFNDSLSYKPKNIASEIQYIIRLDEHGNVVDKLFDRDTDMPKPMPELETGMFGKIGTFHLDECHEIDLVSTDDFIVVGDKVLFVQFNQVYNWSFLNELIDTSTNNQKALYDEDIFTPIEIYKNANLLSNENDEFQVIWRHPKYQAYLDSKSN